MDFISSSGKISFFEMAPMDEIHKFLREALAYVLNVATTHYDRLIFLRYHISDVVFGIEIALQSYYLSRNNATYSEGLYNFKRSKIALSKSSIKVMGKLDIAISLLFESILPYLNAKLKDYFYKNQEMVNTDSNSTKQKWLRRLKRVLDVLEKVSSILNFVYKFRYLVDKEWTFYKPYYHFFGYLIRR